MAKIRKENEYNYIALALKPKKETKMAKKTHDLCVAVRKYTTADGTQKSEWLNIGAVMQDDKGGEYIIINRHFNPAGIPNPDNRHSLIVSRFAVKDRAQGGSEPVATAEKAELNDEVPF